MNYQLCMKWGLELQMYLLLFKEASLGWSKYWVGVRDGADPSPAVASTETKPGETPVPTQLL